MAEYILDVMSQTSKLDWAFPFQRTGAFPIDRSAIFSSLEDAQKYALGLDSNNAPQDERGLGGTSYVGQVISVYEASEEGTASVNAYIITPARGLLKLAATTASGDVAADIANLQGLVNSLSSELESLQETVANKANVSDVYNKTETYTKTEVQTYVQSEIGSAGHLKRVKVDALPAVEEANSDTIYMIKKSANSQLTGDYYEEYMLIDGAFELIGNTYVDLTDYATTEYVDNAVSGIEDTLDGKADQSALDETNTAVAQKAEKTYVDEELAKKADKATTLEGYGITDAATKEYVDAELLKKASQDDHNALVDAVNGKADKATTLEGYGITDAYTKEATYSKEEVDNAIAQIGAIESITIEGEIIAPVEKSVALPLALASKAGLVKSAVVTDGVAAENSISVDESGYMFVNSVNVNKLVQTNGEYLILNGGAAVV